jgi:hypothetical protein
MALGMDEHNNGSRENNMKDLIVPKFLQAIVPTQIGILVPDLAEGIRKWSAILGRNDWLVYTYGPDSIRCDSH